MLAGLHVLRLGAKNLLLHKLRSFLTVLGLLFGVASVIAMLAVGEGASHEALEQLKALGPTNLMARSQRPPEPADGRVVSRRTALTYGLKYGDADRIRAMFPAAEQVVAVRETPKTLRAGARLANSIVIGTTPEYREVSNLVVEEGRWLSAVDCDRAENCAVLGAAAAATLFPLANPVGRTVQAGNTRFAVVGVLAMLGRDVSPGGTPLDQCIFVPITTSRGWRRKTSRSGLCDSWPPSFTSAKIGDSSTRRRTKRPTAMSTTESRNGTRHPQARKSCSESRAERSA